MSDKEAQVDWDDDGFLDLDECYAKIRQLRTRLMMLDSVEVTLADCGTDGFYAEFDTPADAIVHMDDRIKELTTRLATLDAAEALAQLVNEETAALLRRLATNTRSLADSYACPDSAQVRTWRRDAKASVALAVEIGKR